MPKLVHSRDGQFLEDITLQEGSWLIGRRPECDIRLDDDNVSGKHALLTVAASVYMEGLLDVHIEDQGSTNGTTVNGAAMTVTTANVDLDASEQVITAGVIGTQNRPAEAILKELSIVQSVSGTVAVQGVNPTEGDYETVQENAGYNPFSLSPGTIDLLLSDVVQNEDAALGTELRRLIGSV